MFKKLLIKLGILEDPKKAVEQFVSKYAIDTDEHVKVLPKKTTKKPVKKKAPAKKKATKKAK